MHRTRIGLHIFGNLHLLHFEIQWIKFYGNDINDLYIQQVHLLALVDSICDRITQQFASA